MTSLLVPDQDNITSVCVCVCVCCCDILVLVALFCGVGYHEADSLVYSSASQATDKIQHSITHHYTSSLNL